MTLEPPTLTRDRLLNALGLVVLLAFLAPFVAHAVPAVVGAQESYVVLSGSMEPTLGTGGVVFVYATDPGAIGEGDILTYADGEDATQVTTHRVVDVVTRDGERAFVTKGDANEEADPTPVPAEDVVGVVPVVAGVPAYVPFLGRVLLFAGSRRGIALLVFLPAGLLVANEVWTLYREATAGTAGPTREPEEVEEAVTPDPTADGPGRDGRRTERVGSSDEAGRAREATEADAAETEAGEAPAEPTDAEDERSGDAPGRATPTGGEDR